MTFSIVEWFVLVFAILVLVKLVIVSFNPKTWLKVAKSIYKNSAVLFVVELILAAILFYYLLMDLTIVQIFAAITLGALLTGMTFAIYHKETLDWGSKLLKGKTLLNRAWLPVLIWLALAIWALAELF